MAADFDRILNRLNARNYLFIRLSILTMMNEDYNTFDMINCKGYM